MRTFRGVFLILLGWVGIGCDSNRIFDDWVHLEGGQWNRGEKKEYTFFIKDSLAYYDCWTNLRINKDFSFSNIFMQVELTSPDLKKQQMLLEFTLADDQGRWMGKGLGDLYDFHLLHPQLKELRLNKNGAYKISMKQVMRSGDLPGVLAHGISIIKH